MPYLGYDLCDRRVLKVQVLDEGVDAKDVNLLPRIPVALLGGVSKER